jgi:hypothetical protein
VENQRPVSHFPTGCFCTSKSNQERRPWRRIAPLPPLGSFFNEKMLNRTNFQSMIRQKGPAKGFAHQGGGLSCSP